MQKTLSIVINRNTTLWFNHGLIIGYSNFNLIVSFAFWLINNNNKITETKITAQQHTQMKQEKYNKTKQNKIKNQYTTANWLGIL